VDPGYPWNRTPSTALLRLPAPGRPKPLGIRAWACQACGVVHDRDANAARNILVAAGLAETQTAGRGSVSPGHPWQLPHKQEPAEARHMSDAAGIPAVHRGEEVNSMTAPPARNERRQLRRVDQVGR
jgi:hypothetical protein